MYKLKEAFKMTEAEKTRVAELDRMFTPSGGNHEYLNGKRLPKKIQEEIRALYHKYLYPIHNIGWNTNLKLIELEDLKRDPFCKGNSNKGYWVMAYMLGWVANLPETLEIDYLYNTLRSREASRLLIYYAYERA